MANAWRRRGRKRKTVTQGRKTVARGEDKAKETVTIPTQRKRYFGLQAERVSLLPGLPNDITLDHIVSKLPRETFETLTLVSPCWQEAILNREVHDARVRSHSTKPNVVVLYYYSKYKDRLAFYSVEGKFWSKLPLNPHLDSGIPREAQCVPLDGKIYVLGGLKGRDKTVASAEVYVLDLALAGHGQWKQVANMKEARCGFGCGVTNGKIYVFGGRNCSGNLLGSEVYDPNEDTWSPIEPMTSHGSNYQVATMGEDLFVYGRKVFWDGIDPADPFALVWRNLSRYRTLLGGNGRGVSRCDEDFMEIYRPLRKEWEVVELAGTKVAGEILFIAKGRLHSITRDHIWRAEVHDGGKEAWTHLHSHSFEPLLDGRVEPFAAIAVSDEILFLVRWWPPKAKSSKIHLLKSNGFQSEKEQIMWEIADGFLDFNLNPVSFMCSIEL